MQRLKAPNASKHSFLPYLFSCERKDRAVGDNQQSQIRGNLSVSLRLTAPLSGEPFWGRDASSPHKTSSPDIGLLVGPL